LRRLIPLDAVEIAAAAFREPGCRCFWLFLLFSHEIISHPNRLRGRNPSVSAARQGKEQRGQVAVNRCKFAKH
jgi:hypothetical protein